MKYVFKIVNALISISIIPAAIFLEFVFIQMSTSVLDVGIEESFSIKRFYDIFVSGKDPFSFLIKEDTVFYWPDGLDPVKPYLIAFIVFFALAIITALFIFVWSICSGKRIPVIIAGGAGILFSILMNVCFSAGAELFTSGEINIVDALSGGGFLASLVSGFVSVDTLMLGGFKNAFIIIFAAVILWTLAFILVDMGDEKEPKPQKAKH